VKLNHLNLTVSNVPDAHRFLEKYFGLRGFNGMEPREGMSFMSDDNGMLLALFRAAKGTQAKYPAGFHMGSSRKARNRSIRLTNVCVMMDTKSPSRRACTVPGRSIFRRREDSR
jgi:catechol 2,3-dioxygenase-like lactoylglutathione lyase family enzyme